MTQQTPSINIYRIVIPNEDLPEGNDEKVQMVREYARHVTGLEAPNIRLESPQPRPTASSR